MSFTTNLRSGVEGLLAVDALNVDASGLAASVAGLDDDQVRLLIARAGSLIREIGVLQAVLAGVVAQRSSRERGSGGLAAGTGHRTPVELIQATTGITRAEATRAVRVGEALVGAGVVAAADAGGGAAAWHEVLDRRLYEGALSPAQYGAILGGLGDPPRPALDGAWARAAGRLADEEDQWTVEQLTGQARTLRDMLDPAGAEERFARRFERRSFRLWTDGDGFSRGSMLLDDEMGPWLRSVLDAALRPRRGGPRFMTAGERAESEALVGDDRTNEQLSYDVLVDVLRAGALATAKDVFGAREPGVRVIVTDAAADPLGRHGATGIVEDGGSALPGSVVDRAQCAGGRIRIDTDAAGKPLAVGRDERLFTRAQRIALAARDGGCLWPGCERPPSYCEAHHRVPWSEGGVTDTDDGVLLCRFHHLLLHNNGWRIERDDAGFELHAPPSSGREPVPLRSKSPLRWLWDPPPDRAGWRTGGERAPARAS
ncbi:DUF222 domain-containing protein [Microbacterium sp. NPDC077663]|uniref:HNH endonuclease signature motif containing protein n=1 Tax=Microbacterium sp. NPDC077663 TaxID=3364189 RepID=UPI0037C7E2E9